MTQLLIQLLRQQQRLSGLLQSQAKLNRKTTTRRTFQSACVDAQRIADMDYNKKTKQWLIDALREEQKLTARLAAKNGMELMVKELRGLHRDIVERGQKIAEQADRILILEAELFELRKFHKNEVNYDCRPINHVECKSLDGYSVVYDRDTESLVQQ